VAFYDRIILTISSVPFTDGESFQSENDLEFKEKVFLSYYFERGRERNRQTEQGIERER
jgi:hypothetical protein